MYLQINTVVYDTDWEIENIYENSQIIWSQICTHRLLFVYIWSTLNIYWFLGIRILCQRIQTNSYTVTFGYYQYLVQHSMNNTEGKKTAIRCYLNTAKVFMNIVIVSNIILPAWAFSCLQGILFLLQVKDFRIGTVVL